jgi:hypothetical protein
MLNFKYLLFIWVLLVSTAVFLNGQPVSEFIVVDQFGYLPEANKMAVIKNPQTGFDSKASFIPGNTYAVIDAETGEEIFNGSPEMWKNGTTDNSSGDKAWHFDFSSVTTTGTYYILDVEHNVRSFIFNISPSVYNEVLKHTVRTFFYQRSGFKKEAAYAGVAWADEASHIGPLQDKNARLFNDKDNPATERDVHGGWYDAGDYNKYTSWTANYVVEMIKAYLERPEAWTDDYNIPESGNGIPDLLDEVKWGTDHLLRLQFDDGSVISIVGEAHGSPPSSATGPSLYGPPNTSGTLNTAGALAITAKAFRSIGMDEYADTLITRAEKAWNWAAEHPDSLFNNNDPAYNSQGLGAGQMEVNDYGRAMAKLEAACFLYDVTADVMYRDYFDANYEKAHLMAWDFAYPFETDVQETLLYYANLSNATASVSDDIKQTYRNAMTNGEENFPAYYNQKDPYLAHIKDYTWGSNGIKSGKGNMFYNIISYNLSSNLENDALDAAGTYVNYIHGVNPLNFCYLSNVYSYGAEQGVNEFYHSWFSNGSEKWDRVGYSTYGPAPGFLTGGPNPQYDWDNCCPSGCGSSSNNAVCTSESISPPKNQPAQKSYKDFNTSWPLNSWEVTENSCGYQVKYIRLLSKFVDTTYDCNGDQNGDAYIDACGNCVGGNTGKEPTATPCPANELMDFFYVKACETYTSPSEKYVWDTSGFYMDTIITEAGWEKIISIDLTLGKSTRDTINAAACDTYTSPSGKHTWTSSGTYQDTMVNTAGCDSIITVKLQLGTSSETTTLYPEACGSYTTPDGENTWTESGVYNLVYTNASGCDSTITYKVTITNSLNNDVVLTDGTLSVGENDAVYQWLDCNSENSPIEGAVDKSFTPEESGTYAVALAKDACVDTSECVLVEVTGFSFNSFDKAPVLYPNPVTENLVVELPSVQRFVEVEISTIRGSIIFKKQFIDTKNCELQTSFSPGIYIVTVRNNLDQKCITRIIKN